MAATCFFFIKNPRNLNQQVVATLSKLLYDESSVCHCSRRRKRFSARARGEQECLWRVFHARCRREPRQPATRCATQIPAPSALNFARTRSCRCRTPGKHARPSRTNGASSMNPIMLVDDVARFDPAQKHDDGGGGLPCLGRCALQEEPRHPGAVSLPAHLPIRRSLRHLRSRFFSAPNQ